MQVTLTTPLEVGDKTYTTLHLKPLTAGDLIDAVEASEKVQLSIAGEPTVVASPSRATFERARRNVSKISGDGVDDIAGPMSGELLRRVSVADYEALIGACNAIDGAYLDRDGGRDPAAGPGLHSDSGDA